MSHFSTFSPALIPESLRGVVFIPAKSTVDNEAMGKTVAQNSSSVIRGTNGDHDSERLVPRMFSGLHSISTSRELSLKISAFCFCLLNSSLSIDAERVSCSSSSRFFVLPIDSITGAIADTMPTLKERNNQTGVSFFCHFLPPHVV